MPSMQEMAMFLQRYPQIANSPQGQEFLSILRSGDVARGEQMAQNFCSSYGVTPQEALAKAQQFFMNGKNF